MSLSFCRLVHPRLSLEQYCRTAVSHSVFYLQDSLGSLVQNTPELFAEFSDDSQSVSHLREVLGYLVQDAAGGAALGPLQRRQQR